MTIALLPLRSLHDGKRRLQAAYSSTERAALIQELARRVVSALADSGAIARTLVVSPDSDLLVWAASLGVETLPQPGQGLNQALEYARHIVWRAWPSAPIMVVLPDLPLITAADIAAMDRLGTQHTAVVAPDRHGAGTNAMWLPPAVPLPFMFGAGSLRAHQQAAAALDLQVQCYQSDGTALDIDTPNDLELLQQSLELMPKLP